MAHQLDLSQLHDTGFIKDLIAIKAREYGVDPDLAIATAQQESGFNINARSPVGAYGVFQLMPATAKGLRVDYLDPFANIQGGIKYLAIKRRQHGNYTLGLASYNAGSGAVTKYHGIPPYKETQNYVKTIKQNFITRKLRAIFGE